MGRRNSLAGDLKRFTYHCGGHPAAPLVVPDKTKLS